MRVRLVALDVDGTLVRRDGTVDARDRAAVVELQRRGVPVTLITGRLWTGTRALADEVGIDAPALACADGAELVDPRSGEELEWTPIAGTAAIDARRVISEEQLAAFLMLADGIVHDGSGDIYARYLSNWSPELWRVDDVGAHPSWSDARGICAIVAVGEPDRVRRAAVALRAPDALEVTDFGVSAEYGGGQMPPSRALLLHARGVHKGTALRRLASRTGCLPAEVAVIGDWLNDIDMFRVAGRSFAMAQAPRSVRDAATDLLSASAAEGGGVAEAVERILREG